MNTADQFAQVVHIVQNRCASCHAEKVTQPGFVAAPKGVLLDTPERIAIHATQIYQQVASRAMPLGNLTGMTDQERQFIGACGGAGAPSK